MVNENLQQAFDSLMWMPVRMLMVYGSVKHSLQHSLFAPTWAIVRLHPVTLFCLLKNQIFCCHLGGQATHKGKIIAWLSWLCHSHKTSLPARAAFFQKSKTKNTCSSWPTALCVCFLVFISQAWGWERGKQLSVLSASRTCVWWQLASIINWDLCKWAAAGMLSAHGSDGPRMWGSCWEGTHCAVGQKDFECWHGGENPWFPAVELFLTS